MIDKDGIAHVFICALSSRRSVFVSVLECMQVYEDVPNQIASLRMLSTLFSVRDSSMRVTEIRCVERKRTCPKIGSISNDRMEKVLRA